MGRFLEDSPRNWPDGSPIPAGVSPDPDWFEFESRTGSRSSARTFLLRSKYCLSRSVPDIGVMKRRFADKWCGEDYLS